MSFFDNNGGRGAGHPVRRSLLGSIKDKLTRTAAENNDSSPRSTAQNQNRARNAPPSPTANRISRSPLLNPSPPTRRPHDEPPPPYNEVVIAPTFGPGAGAAGGAGAGLGIGVATSQHRSPSLAPSAGSNVSRLTVGDVTTPEDPYAFLTTFDTIFVIDDSGSMAGRSWREVGAVLGNITPICTAHDADGIDLYFLNHKTPNTAPPGSGKASGGYLNVRDTATVNQIFETVRPGYSTPTGTRINSILRPYLRHYKEKMRENPDEPDVKPINMIVITDGEPSDDLEGVLHSAAQKLDDLDAPPFQVGVQFFKVGNEPGAAEYLRQLDDNLGELVHGRGVRDMVDTVTWDAHIPHGGSGRDVSALTAEGILKAVLGAVIKRLDRLPTGPAQQ